MHTISVSVIICTRNRPDDIVAFLFSLSQQTYTDFELIVVDSSYQPLQNNEQFNNVTKSFENRYNYLHTDPGLTLQRNKGVSIARGEIIYFFDDDVILQPDYLAVMQDTFAQYPHYLGGMGTIINMQSRPSLFWRHFNHFFLLHQDYATGFFTLSGMATHAYGTQQFKQVEALGGCCMAFRKHVLDKHTFDENLERYAYMEDCDISWRVSRDGPLFFQPAANLQHNTSAIARDSDVENRAMFLRNYRYLFFKNVYPTNRLRILFYWWTFIGLFVQAVLMRDRVSLQGYVSSYFTK